MSYPSGKCRAHLIRDRGGLEAYLTNAPDRDWYFVIADIRSMLTAAAEQDPSRPHLYVSSRCEYLLATLPNAVRDEKDPDDIADTPHCPDHGIDACRYLLSWARERQSITTGQIIGNY